MATRVNATDARDIALHFYDLKNWRPDARMGRSVNTVKKLLRDGYTKEEIISVMDYVFENTTMDIYSIGYFNHCINETLDKIKKDQIKLTAKSEKLSVQAPIVEDKHNGSTERNKAKLSRNNSKSNIGKKYNFDMFTE